jgi:hypothetical protein
MDKILIFIAPLVGLVVGAILQAHFAQKNNNHKNLSELQNKAYADFLNSASSIAVAQRYGDREKVTSELSKLADAKSRICVYGSSNVINQLANFIRQGGTLQTEQEILAFTRLCITIRSSVGMRRDAVFSTDISQLLFSVDVKDTPTPRKTDC